MSREKGFSPLEDKERICRFLTMKTYGYTSIGISDKLRIPIYRVRRAVTELLKEKVIDWRAKWYGKNAGYTRIYYKS